jgi:hypothetical protein
MPSTLETGLMKVRLGFAGKIYRLQIWSLECRLVLVGCWREILHILDSGMQVYQDFVILVSEKKHSCFILSYTGIPLAHRR